MKADRKSDGELMVRVATGDRIAQRQLVDSHLHPLFALAFRILQDRALAEDVCQDCFLRLWQAAPNWQPKAKISTWLYRVAYNLCVDELRRQRRLSNEEVAEQVDPGPDPLAIRQHRDIETALSAALQKLPLRQRTAITLVHHQELSNIEAAEVMAVSVEALESLLSRGRKKLRGQLKTRKEELIGAL